MIRYLLMWMLLYDSISVDVGVITCVAEAR